MDLFFNFVGFWIWGFSKWMNIFSLDCLACPFLLSRIQIQKYVKDNYLWGQCNKKEGQGEKYPR